jgi:biopolymer transport protein TolR
MRGPDAEDFVADINMTPFVDIVLVLLIIFMISAPLMESRLDVQLPVSESKTDIAAPDTFEVVVIKQEGQIDFMNKKFESIKPFKAYLDSKNLSSTTPIFIRADERISYGLVSQVLGILKTKGVQAVSLVTRDK